MQQKRTSLILGAGFAPHQAPLHLGPLFIGSIPCAITHMHAMGYNLWWDPPFVDCRKERVDLLEVRWTSRGAIQG